MVKDGRVMPNRPIGFGVDPGQTKELVWKFTTPGTYIYGCHTPGRYAAGMLGVVTVR